MWYTVHAYDVAGYSFNADIYCEDCMREIAKQRAVELGSATMWGDCGSAEEILSEWASLAGIDHKNERSYDSSDFPKVIFADSAHSVCNPSEGYQQGQCGDRCGACGEPIGFECPNS